MFHFNVQLVCMVGCCCSALVRVIVDRFVFSHFMVSVCIYNCIASRIGVCVW